MKKINSALFLITNLFIAVIIVFNASNVFSQNYKTPKYIQVTINWLQAKSSDSCNGKMDFRGWMSINNKLYRFDNIVEGNFIKPNWSVKTTANNNDFNWVNISIMDDDDGFCGGEDDIVDINPETNQYRLTIAVDPRYMRVYYYPKYKEYSGAIHVGNVGEGIVLQGYDYKSGVETGVICFTAYLFY